MGKRKPFLANIHSIRYNHEFKMEKNWRCRLVSLIGRMSVNHHPPVNTYMDIAQTATLKNIRVCLSSQENKNSLVAKSQNSQEMKLYVGFVHLEK